MENVQDAGPSTNRPITADDVMAACITNGVNPLQTNAAKVRAVLGRGSFATIQKHLDSLRQSAAPQRPADMAVVPAAPADVLSSLWSAAYNAAGLQLGARLAVLMTELDGWKAKAAGSADDVTALAAQVDELEASKAVQATELATAQAVVQSAAEAAQAVQADLIGQLDVLKTELAQVRANAVHSAELAARDLMIERQSMQTTVNRLTDQIGELKSLVALQARPSQA